MKDKFNSEMPTPIKAEKELSDVKKNSTALQTIYTQEPYLKLDNLLKPCSDDLLKNLIYKKRVK